MAALGRSRFEAEVEAVKRLSRQEAIRLAPGFAGMRKPAWSEATAALALDGEVGPLGKREAAVARLVSEGLSNQQIGARLFISERTLDSYVRSILNKLGFNSRAQIAGWIASANQPPLQKL